MYVCMYVCMYEIPEEERKDKENNLLEKETTDSTGHIHNQNIYNAIHVTIICIHLMDATVKLGNQE